MYKRIAVVAATRAELPRIKGPVTITATGVGRVSVRKRIKRLVEKYSPDLVISVGTAGAVTETLRPGDIVIPETIIDYENPHKKYPVGFPIDKSGTLVTVPGIFSREDKLKLKETIPAAAIVDMETSAAAEVLWPLGISLLCIKAISDGLHFKFPDPGLIPGGKKTRGLLFLRPYNIWRLAKLRYNMKKAVIAYTKFLCELLPGIQI